MENAIAVIWKTLILAQRSFRKLDSHRLLGEVAEGAVYVNGVREKKREELRSEKKRA